jgi:hypothetical protein
MISSKVVYRYHPETKEYLGETQADSNPKEEGQWLLPAHSTEEVPPEKTEGHSLVFDGLRFVNVVDNRGKTYWIVKKNEEGKDVSEKIQIQVLGDVQPEDSFDEEPDLRTLGEVKVEAIERVAISHSNFLRELTGGATIEERDTWQAKALAAEAIANATPSASQLDMITTEAELTGENIADLVQKILVKYRNYSKLIGLAAGMKRKTESEILEASSISEIDEILEQASAEALLKVEVLSNFILNQNES